MAYPMGSSISVRSVAPTWAAGAMSLSVAAVALVLTGLALSGDAQTHQAINRADKADSLVSSAELKAKRDVDTAWYQLFHERELADPRAPNQFDGVAMTSTVRLEKVAVNQGNDFVW